MKVTKVKIKRLIPVKGHIGFVSFVIDDWLYLGNIAVFSRLNQEDKIRLVFPEKKVGDKKIQIFYPLTPTAYYELEGIILEHFKNI